MPTDPSMSQDEAVRTLLQEQIVLLKEIHAATQKTRRYIVWAQVWSLVKLAIIIVPLIVGFWFLKPYFQTAFSSYQELLDSPSAGGDNQQSFDLLEQLKNYQGQ
ncbi:MAG: hypothetical protein U1C53_00190 [Candidatus Veblenbacteria bacterium]|nr:hypothetical protein [Candidatus Veblenbacteria bacterium]MDZ4229540.1 hypothetical protein [Candidatus Veblenbacteria bacterium]